MEAFDRIMIFIGPDRYIRVEYDEDLIAWTEGNEENTAWQDAWQPEQAEERARRVESATARAERMRTSAGRRVRPRMDEKIEDAEGGTSVISSGGIVRRPRLLVL
ncbi:hypothetical protein CYMTET_28858 [Cymbomonas tetramitiformis]|uniref:Uncharacterized protein n=1 Tax=Cymbomonas tetramitiformis TaxID=36881 RepID=A0AAE0KVH6_9CHLO|nr:hypothetical protein CYMTET_28858 [Cymbomonas tetramitiformis]